VIKPITPSLPPKRHLPESHLFRQNAIRLNAPAGLAGAPEVVIPIKLVNGLTFGIGLLGAIGEDAAILNRLW
jgi:Asp-tRNA(Asn)/Glu-tRNA(Gln) amidotransferase A subunit family amidase